MAMSAATALPNVLQRLRSEFMEMHGLQLTHWEVERLCGIDATLCQAALDALVEERFLVMKADGRFARLTDGKPQTKLQGEPPFKKAS